MGHKGMLLLLVSALACLGGVARASEPPVSPWQVLNPPLREEGDAYDIGPLENTYPEEQETDANVATYEDEEEEYIPELPFKLPFKMDKKQVAVAMKLLKEAVKPILKSKSLRETLAYFDEALASFSSDIETQLYLRLILDSAQDLYEGKESAQIHMIMKDFFTDMSDEETARTIDDVWDYMSPAMDEWFYTPVREYLVAPVRDYVYYPFSNAINDFADRIGRLMGGRYDFYDGVEYPQYQRWSDRVNMITSRISKLTSITRRSLEDAVTVLDAQDNEFAARACGGACGSSSLDDDLSAQSVE
ncbi:uncharacterized protein LOC122254340 [Penaeus japonicus]|uniref:uncharacterized protein LOC122254340 n=1 Tax=Penaeus japonicus TaxID=27405 RepID=UPI001C70BBD4|nr:uncharacterized protein LOC122254340 [Penaeus japonicus]